MAIILNFTIQLLPQNPQTAASHGEDSDSAPSCRLCVALLPTIGNAQLRRVYVDSDSLNAINRISFFSASEGYVAFTKWIGHTTDSGRTFTPLYITSSNVNYNGYSVNLTFGFAISGVKAIDRNKLIAYGNYGSIPAILYSSNGGGGWTLVFQSQFSSQEFNSGVTDMLFPADVSTGYAVDADRILKTTDGGQSWTIVDIAAGSFFNHLEAIDNNAVFAMNTTQETSVFLRTTNGGVDWSPVPMPPLQNLNLNYAYFLTANMGWMSVIDDDDKSYFFKTTNGGVSWTQQNNTTATPFSCYKMRFTDANTGYALVSGFQVYKTLTSGVLWEPLPRDNAFTYLNYTLNDLQCWSGDQLWVGGGHGFLELSTNGGGTPIPTAHFSIDTTNENTTGVVHLVNYSNPAYQFRWYVNDTLVSAGYDTSYTHTLSRSSDTITLIVTGNGLSDTLTQQQYFSVPNLPAITSFGPQAGGTGTLVGINGSGFSNVTTVSFGGVPASSFTIVSDKLIWATVGNGASGAVGVGDIHGTSFLPSYTWYPSPGAPPVITSVVPSAGPVGTTVTISGSGFSGSSSSNKVLFGSINAVVQSASPTALVCAVPPGASFDNIYVYNTANGLLGQSPRQFNVTFADSANFTSNSFSPVLTYNFGEYTGTPAMLVGRDLDGDGKPDLLVAMFEGGRDSMTVYRNISQKGTIALAPRVDVGSLFDNGAGGIFGANDLDGDGLADIAAVDNAGDVVLFRNTSKPGSISFSQPIGLVTPNGDLAIAIGDLDGDGRNDLAVTCVAGQLSILRNTGGVGTLAFASAQNIAIAAGNVAIGDIDGDGKKEVVTLDNSGAISVFPNTSVPGSITLGPKMDFTAPNGELQGYYLTLADVDGDGRLDVVAGNNYNICVFKNISTPGHFAFSQPTLIPIQSGQGFSQSNFGGGSRPDIAAGSWGVENLSLYRNATKQGIIVYNPVVQIADYLPYNTAAVDFDLDGKPDIAVDNDFNDGGSTVILKNNVGVPVPFKVCKQVAYELISDVSGSHYQWQRDMGTGFVPISDNDTLSGTQTTTLLFENTPLAWNGFKYRCLVDSLYSSTFVLDLSSTSSGGVNVQTTDSVICYGAPVTFTAAGVPGDSVYSYTWLLNGRVSTASTTSQFQSATLRDKDQVQVVLGYVNACGYFYDSSRVIAMKVTEVLDSVTVSTPANIVCSGTPVVFTATPVNPGPTPTYTWTVNSVVQPETGPVFSASSLSTSQANLVQVTMTGSAACRYPIDPVSNVATINVMQQLPASVSISVDYQTNCVGNWTNFMATAGSTVINPSYEWLVNGIGTGVTSTDFYTKSLHNDDTVQCKVTGTVVCPVQDSGVSNAIVVTELPLGAPSVTVSPQDTDVCIGSEVTFTAQVQIAGSSTDYQWSKAGQPVGTNSPTYSDAGLTGSDAISASIYTTGLCLTKDTASSFPVTLRVDPLPSVLISSDTVVASGAQATVTSTVTNGGSAPGYQWQDSTAMHGWQDIGNVQGASIKYTPAVSGDQVRCIVTSPVGCTAISNSFSFTVNTAPTKTRFYPNPVTSTLHIQNIPPSDGINSVRVTTATGNVSMVLDNLGGLDNLALNVSSLSKGIYFVTVWRMSGAVVRFTFVKM